MPNLRNRYPARRRFLKQSAALTATVSLAAPLLVVAQPAQPATAEPQPAQPAAGKPQPARLAAAQPQAAAGGQDSARKRPPAL